MRQIKRHLVVVILVTTALAQAPQLQAPQLKEAEFHSRSLGRPMKYRILLPASYPQGDTRYPVLYLLHGLFGDQRNWTELTSIQKYATGMNLIVVMPDADDSWYTNWDSDPKQKFEDYIIKDLVTEIDSRYRTLAARDNRFIAGLSMGGYGALKFGLEYHDRFSVAASFSGALNAAGNLETERPEFARQLIRVFGPPGSATRKSNDIFNLIKRKKPQSLPYLYLTCGSDDFLLAANRKVVSALSAAQIRQDYHELSGAHTWNFWDHSIQSFLQQLKQMGAVN